MTQQPPDLVIHPQTRRYSLVDPGSEGLLRPEPVKRPRVPVVPLAPRKQRRYRQTALPDCEYPGLANRNTRMSKYADAVRVRVAGGEARKLMPHEIERWYDRLAAIQQRAHEPKPIGPLVEKSR